VRKDFGLMVGRKKRVHFLARGIAKNVWEKSNEEKEEQEGLIAKFKNANNFRQRKLF
jgi:hypothetical protein